MELDMIKRGLRAEIKKREKETYATCQTNVRDMCTDVLSKLEEQEKEIAELKSRLEDAKATAYAESVDAGMALRKTQRALWLARAELAKWQSLYYWYAISDKCKSRKFDDVERKCRAKAEEYK